MACSEKQQQKMFIVSLLYFFGFSVIRDVYCFFQKGKDPV